MTFDTQKTIPSRPILESYWVLPGQLLAGEYPGVPYVPEITRKRIDSFLNSGFNTFINLTSPGETEPYEPILREQAGYYGKQVETAQFPIGDYGLPTIEAMRSILDKIDTAISARRKIYVHCYGGIGRTGTVIGCYLARHGLSGEEAIKHLAAMWKNVPKSNRYPHSPETIQQEDFIRNWPEQKR